MGEGRDAGGAGRADRLLIVNADDYALTEGVSRAVLAAARDGIVTSTSVLAVGPAFDGTASWLVDVGLGTGAHLAAVGEDPPILTAREIPTLVDRRGAFNRSWRSLLTKVAAAATGHDEAGALVGPRLVGAIDRLGAGPEPTAELATHPGEAGDPDLVRYRWGYAWADELEALRSAEARAAVERNGFRLGTYADLVAP